MNMAPIDIYPVSCGHVLLFALCVRTDGLGFRITTLTIPYDDYVTLLSL